MIKLYVVSLNLTNHRYVVLHANIIVSIDLVVALLNVLCFHVHQVYIWLLFAAVFLRKVEVKWRDQLVHSTVRAVIVIVIECCRASAAVAAHERLVRDE